MIILGFFISLVGTVRERVAARKYTRLSGNIPPEQTPNELKSYHNSSEYATSSNQKVVTYCVVDPRLVEK